LASLVLAGALTAAFGGAALAQDWSNSPETDISYRVHHRYYGPRAYGYAPYGYYRDGYYRDGYYDAGPLGLPGAIVGSALGIADTAATVATGGYPYGYYHAYGYDPYYGGPYYGYGY